MFKGVSLGTRISFLPSFRATSAALDNKFLDKPLTPLIAISPQKQSELLKNLEI